jgi:hypothetical protein
MSFDTVGMSTSPLKSLGLTDPSELSFQDPELGRAYAEFCSGLRFVREGVAIKASYYDKKEETLYDNFKPFADSKCEESLRFDLARLKLLATLYRPDKERIRRLYDRSAGFEAPVELTVLYRNPKVLSIEIAKSIREFTKTGKHPPPDLKQILRNTIPAKTLVRLVLRFLGSPIMPWITFEAITFTEQWVAIFMLPDAEDSEYNIFPELVGFASRGDLHFAMALLLSNVRSTHFYGEPPSAVQVIGCTDFQQELLVMSITDEYDYLYKEWNEGVRASWVLQRIEELREELTDEGLQMAYKQYGSLCGFLTVLDEIISLDGDLAEDRERREVVWFDREILRALIRKYGSPDRLGYFKKIHRKLLRDLEVQKRAEEEMEELFKAAVKRAAPVFSPDDLPADMDVSQPLTEFQVLGLEKWISTLPGVKEVINFQKRSFRWINRASELIELEFVDERGQRRKVEVKVEGFGRRVRFKDAFQQLLSQLEDQNPKQS